MNSKLFSFNSAKIALLMLDEWIENFPQKKNRISTKRIFEKEITTYLLSTYLPNHILSYNSNGKPFLVNGGFLSISHSKSIIGIAWSFDYNIGLDIEEINDRIQKVENRFISDNEMKFAQTLEDKTRVWTIKEALIKIYDDKTFNLKTDLIVQKNEESNWMGLTTKKPFEIHEFITFEYCNNIICINKSSEK
jgi:phosphopantetheinyl transferase (holo-ACP synthase)